MVTQCIGSECCGSVGYELTGCVDKVLGDGDLVAVTCGNASLTIVEAVCLNRDTVATNDAFIPVVGIGQLLGVDLSMLSLNQALIVVDILAGDLNLLSADHPTGIVECLVVECQLLGENSA